MPDSPPANPTSSELTRRRLLVKAGAAGAGTLALGALGKVGLDGTARAAGIGNDALRRSSYLDLSTTAFTATVDGGSHKLELIGVEDLPVAASVPTLRDSDDAFSLRFRGDGRDSFPQGTWAVSHPQLGSFQLFMVPIEQRTGTQDYEAVIDRTVSAPSRDDGGVPRPVDPGDRASTSSAGGVGDRRIVPRLRRATLRRSRSGRRLWAEVALGNASSVKSVNATLLRRGKVVGSASASPRGGRALLRFGTRPPKRGASYVLALTAIDGNGQVTRLRKPVRIA
jgi:hypothetical protein